MFAAGRGLTGALAVAVVLALAGCGSGKTVGDGDLGGDWVLFAEPKVPVPEANVCRRGHNIQVSFDMAVFNEVPVPCSGLHDTETFYVGELTGAAAAGSSPPEVGDPAFRTATDTCTKQANNFLGGDWHTARVAVVAVPPTDTQWRGEARFLRCEILEIKNTAEDINTRTGSLKNGLRGKKPLAIGCVNFVPGTKVDTVVGITFLSCSKAHLMEFTGIFTAPNKPHAGAKQNETNLTKCYAIGAKYLGMTTSQLDGVGGIQWMESGGSETHYSIGDRVVRCYLGPYPDKKLTRSIKGKTPDQF